MNWTPIWHQAAAPAFAMGSLSGKKKTVVFRVISHTAGNRLRIHFSNHYGKKPYQIGGLTVWVRGEMHKVTCSGNAAFSVPAGGCYSDELTLSVAQAEELEVRLFYVSKVMDSNMTEEDAVVYRGDHTGDRTLPPVKKEPYKIQYNLYDAVPAMDQIEVFTSQPARVIVAFGDSITAMNRWVKPLQERLLDAYGGRYALLNAGISGNCLLYDVPGLMGKSYGEKGVSRFERDVLDFPELHGVIFALGVNDAAYYSPKTAKAISYEKYVSAASEIAQQLRGMGVRVTAQTLPPREGFVKKGYTREMEDLRIRINGWLRESPVFDYVFDADAVLRDKDCPSVAAEQYHQGDHLHPNKAGGLLLARSCDLAKLVGEE